MLDLSRLPDWRVRFEAVADDIKGRPFDWKTQHDCGPGLVGALVRAMTGEDVAKRWRGTYRTERGALRVMRREGFRDLADLVASMLPEVHPSQARIGDIAAFATGSAFGHALGVVNGERVLVLRPEGFGSMGLLDAARAFRVG